MREKFSVFSFQFSVHGAAALLSVVAVSAFAAETPTTLPATQPALVEPRPILSPQQKREAALKVIDAFVAHVNASPAVAASAKTAIAQGWEQHRADEDPSEFLSAGIAILSEPYRNAVAALEKEEYPQAEAALRSMTDNKDPYVSLHASALLARALVEQEKLEEAQAVLAPLATREQDLIEKSFLEAEVDFLLGYCQLSNLYYEEAQRTLQNFERQHPDAPERFRLSVRQMLQELAARRPEGLGEVADLMVYAGRRLGVGRADKPVQTRQERAVELLNKLIKEAEDQENQQANSQSGGGNSQGQGQQQGQAGGQRSASPAEESTRPGGKGRIGELHRSGVARPGEEWGKMPPEERERVLQSLRRHFPSQYRELVEQYYRQLAKER
ncbi:MAG TPA: uL15m family ribosomal protein [Phycisphaerae bacterium]|jgi:TolA-binding protein|nr:hypothetical protein [Phycisphaerae bacterium]HOB73360.1 uL15m family ribosomal protein [Phycisphaerae bacterium]HOJ55205.1 uL15m family ribosomal protein [Phycisphaerae bacterium]HOL25002.1 uL15m family ribosomal protein [Phycisphaerae bacterium]HPP20104.1 uL15m family ribosomal protein [Phycisphaerae bacterium]